MGTNCAPLVADLFLYCYERDFMDSLNHDNQADVIEAKVTEWPPIGKIAAHSAYDMFHGICTWLFVWFFPTSVF